MAQTVSVTLLACHAVPEGWDREAWVSAVCRDLIPAAADQGLAEAVDVYVEDIAFTVDDLRRVADAAREHGLRARAHADQLGWSGAAEAAVRFGARSADHLNHAGAEGVAALGAAGQGDSRGSGGGSGAGGGSEAAAAATVAVLLPVSTMFIRAERPPVEDLARSGRRDRRRHRLQPRHLPVLFDPRGPRRAPRRCTASRP